MLAEEFAWLAAPVAYNIFNLSLQMDALFAPAGVCVNSDYVASLKSNDINPKTVY
jgi:hypothetical protein